jgi:hypothetical protein
MGAAFDLLRDDLQGVLALEDRYPAARRLSAEDLPERRSATIS